MRLRLLAFGLFLGCGLGLPLPAWSADYHVPPNVWGNLDGTSSNDTFSIDANGRVLGSVKGLGGDDVITNHGEIGFDLNGGAGTNQITNSGYLGQDIIGGENFTSGSDSGGNTIENTSTGDVDYIIGSHNLGASSSGNDNIINNAGTAASGIFGSYNEGAGSQGGNNTITNSGTSGYDIIGSANEEEDSKGGGNTIVNNGGVFGSIYGSANDWYRTEGGDNHITNNAFVVGYLFGSFNGGDGVSGNSGGGNTIINNGETFYGIMGSYNGGTDSIGGHNIISNPGRIYLNIYGSYNDGPNSEGGNNTITNSGIVEENIYGSYNRAPGSKGGGNSINNSGTVQGDIYGSLDLGKGSSSTGNTITNSGTVDGSIYAGGGDDTVIIQGASSVGGHVDGQQGRDSLGFKGAGVRGPGQYLNFEHLFFGGSGTTTLKDDWNFSGDDTVIESGTVLVAGSLRSASLTNRGALGGTGVVHATVTNYGAISPGNSVGTLTVDGPVIFEPGSTLRVEIEAVGSADLLNVTGSATINGGTINATIPRSLLGPGNAWQVLNADGGLSGSFDGVDCPTCSAVMVLRIFSSAKSVSLEPARIPYADFAQTTSQRSVGWALDVIRPTAQATGDAMGSLLSSVDWDYSADQIRGMLTALNPEMYTAFTAASLEAGGLFDWALNNRLDDQRLSEVLGPAPAGTEETGGPGWSVWARGLGYWADRDAEGGYLGRGQHTGGAAAGADYAFRDWLRLGLAAGGTRTDLNWSQGGYGGDLEAVHTGLYGQAGAGPVFVRLLATYASLRSSADRAVDFKDASTQADADFDGDLFGAGLSAGYGLRTGGWLIEPGAGLTYQHLEEDGFSESGAGYLDLNIDSRDHDSLLSRLGLRVARRFQAGAWELLPNLGLAWLHQLCDGRPELSAAFSGYGSTSFGIQGAEFPTDQTVFMAGITAGDQDGFGFFAQYQFSRAEDYYSQTISAGLRISF